MRREQRVSRQVRYARWLGLATTTLVLAAAVTGLLMGVRHGAAFFSYPVHN
jgi:hypothetical protein